MCIRDRGENVQVQLVGDSTKTLAEIADEIVPMLSKRKELRDVRVNAGDQNSELSVRVDRERAAAFGFNAQQVASFVGIAPVSYTHLDVYKRQALMQGSLQVQ